MRPPPAPAATDLGYSLDQVAGPDAAGDQVVGDGHVYAGPLARGEEDLNGVAVLIPGTSPSTTRSASGRPPDCLPL